jgi:hypothetical protein
MTMSSEKRGFDSFAKAMGEARSRRAMLKVLFGGATAMIVGYGVAGGDRAAAAASAALTCSKTNKASTPCAELNAYVNECGVICPGGERLLGKGGCTVADASGDIPPWRVTFARSGAKWCASTTVDGKFTADPKSAVLDWKPSQPACCPDVCANEVKTVLDELAAHEAAHRKIILDAVDAATKAWTNRKFSACAATKNAASDALDAKIKAAFAAEQAQLEKEFKKEPPEPRSIDCRKCTPKTKNNECCNGKCVAAGQCQKYWCPCNKMCYTSETTCQSDCPVSLGCFVNICPGVTTCPPSG